MAETEEKNSTAPRRGSRLALAAAAVVLASITVTVTLWWLMQGESTPGDEAVASEPPPARYVSLQEPLVVNYSAGRRQRHVQIAMTAMTRDAEVVEAIETHLP